MNPPPYLFVWNLERLRRIATTWQSIVVVASTLEEAREQAKEELRTITSDAALAMVFAHIDQTDPEIFDKCMFIRAR